MDAAAPDAPPPLESVHRTESSLDGAGDLSKVLQTKSSARSSRATSPRENVVFPDETGDVAPASAWQHGPEQRASARGLPTLSSRSNPHSIPLSARKYAVPDWDEKTGPSSSALAPPSAQPPATPAATLPASPPPQPSRPSSSRHRPNLRQFVPSRTVVRGTVATLARELPKTLKTAVHTSKRAYNYATLQQIIAYALLLLGMLSEAFTPAPRHNTPLGVLLFVVPASQFPHRLVVSGLGAGVLLDIFWLLRPQEVSFNGYFAVRFVSAAQLSLAACTLVKLWLIFSAYFDLQEVEDEDEAVKKGRRSSRLPVSYRLWDQIKFVFPRKTMPKRSQLSFEVLMRVLALVWIHGVLGVVLLLLALIAAASYTTRPQFRSKPLGLPLHIAMLFKAATTLLVYFCITHRMSYNGCLGLTIGGITGYRAKRDDVVLRYNKVWLQRVQRAKALDTLVGVYTLLALFMASHSGEGVATLSLKALLGFTAASLLILELWTPLLILTAAKCGARLHELHRLGEDAVDDPYFPNQIQWSDGDDDEGGGESDGDDSGEEEDDGGDDDSSDSGEDSTRRVSGIRLRERQRERNRGRGSDRTSRQVDQNRRPSRQRLLHGGDESDDDSDGNRGGHHSARRPSLVIVNADSLGGSLPSGPVWVRHFDPSSRRPFLVHSITGESVWEIVNPRVDSNESPMSDGDETDEAKDKPKRSARTSRQTVSGTGSSRSRNGSNSSRRSAQDGAPEPRLERKGNHSARANREDELANAEVFNREWASLGADSGAFTCRVSRIPSSSELAAHLARQGFSTISDSAIGDESSDHRRVAHFLVPVDSGDERALFLGEFTFDTAALTLCAAFRCARADAVVEFVRRLQLKEIVGAYSPLATGSE